MFADRRDAGRQLAQRLTALRGPNLVVLGLDGGGVPVAVKVAEVLDAPLDVIVVRKLDVPGHTELAVGAVGEGGARVINRHVMHLAGVTDVDLPGLERAARDDVRRHASTLRQGRAPLSLAGRTAVIVGEGMATGFTAQAACLAARARGAVRVIVAVPVAPLDAIIRLRRLADQVVCVDRPAWFGEVGEWYRDFRQVSEGDVAEILDRAAVGRPVMRPAAVDIDAHGLGRLLSGAV
jgi:predicted phosphoribosyltransferase